MPRGTPRVFRAVLWTHTDTQGELQIYKKVSRAVLPCVFDGLAMSGLPFSVAAALLND